MVRSEVTHAGFSEPTDSQHLFGFFSKVSTASSVNNVFFIFFFMDLARGRDEVWDGGNQNDFAR